MDSTEYGQELSWISCHTLNLSIFPKECLPQFSQEPNITFSSLTPSKLHHSNVTLCRGQSIFIWLIVEDCRRCILYNGPAVCALSGCNNYILVGFDHNLPSSMCQVITSWLVMASLCVGTKHSRTTQWKCWE